MEGAEVLAVEVVAAGRSLQVGRVQISVCEAILTLRREMANAKQVPEFDPATLDALIGDAKSPEHVVRLMRAIQKRLGERMLPGEPTAHLGYAPGAPKPEGQANYRNGAAPKTVLTDAGAVPPECPRLAREPFPRPAPETPRPASTARTLPKRSAW